MSNIVGIPSRSDKAKTSYFATNPQKVSTDKVDITLYNNSQLSLSSVRKRHNGELYISEVQYRTDDYIAGFELSYEIKGYKVVDIVYKWGNKDSQLNIKSYITQVSKANKKIISYYNPDSIAGISAGLNYITKDPVNNNTAFFVLLEKVSEDCYFEISSKHKSIKNLDNTGISILESVPLLSKWDLNVAFGPEALKNPSYIKRAAQMAVTNLYDENIDIDSSLNTIDVLDIVGMCNHRWYMLNHNATAVNNRVYVPSYVEVENSFVSKTDLVDADLKIKNIDIQYSSGFFDLAIDIGFNASVSAHGWQFDIARNWESYSFVDHEDNSLIKPNVVFKGQLEELKQYYDYRVVSIDNRFGNDNITRVSIYRKPFNGESPSALVDISRQNILLNSYGTAPRKFSETIVRLEWNNIKKSSNLEILPRKEYYFKKDSESTSDNIESNLTKFKKGDRWYGDANYDSETSTWYTGEYFHPLHSVELEVKWDLFSILNRKAITNSNLSFIKHYSRTEQDLLNFSYQFAYPEEGPTANLGVLEKYGDDYQAYAESILGYVNSTIMNGLSSGPNSKYDFEPIVPSGYLAGYMNDHDLSGTKNIVDTSALSNLFTIRMSTNADGESEGVITANSVRNIIDSKVIPGEKNSNDVPGKRVYKSTSVDRKILNSLNKIVPTLIINENSTLTYPEFSPTIVDSNSDGSTVYFSEGILCNSSTLPKEFRSWKQYFSEMYDISHDKIPRKENFFFTQVNLATNSEKAKYLREISFSLDFDFGLDFWLQGLGVHFADDQDDGGVYIFGGSNVKNISAYADNTPLQGGLGGINNVIDQVHLTLDNSGDYFPAVTSNGGSLNLLNVFVFLHNDSSENLEHQLLQGDTKITISEQNNDLYDSAEIKWSNLPRQSTSDDLYIEDRNNNTLLFGPKLSYKNFYLKDNSTSVRTYDDVDIFLQVENKREATIRTIAAEPYRTGSFSIALNQQVEVDIESFSSNFNHDAPVKSEDGLQKWNLSYSSSSDVTGSVEVGRMKFSEDIFENDIEDADPNVEVINPPIGTNKTLVSPYISENYIYPTWNNCILHSDTSDENYVKFNAANEVSELSNLFSDKSFTNSSTADLPLYNSEIDFGGGRKSVYFDNGKKIQIDQDISYDRNSNLFYSSNIAIEYKDMRNRFTTDINKEPIVEVVFHDGTVNSFTSSISFIEEEELQEQYESLKESLGFNVRCNEYLEQLFISGSIFALKESYDHNGGIIKEVLTQNDLDEGYEITEDTKFIFNDYGNWGNWIFGTGNVEPSGDEGFYSESELLSANSPLTGSSWPGWYFTVSGDGNLRFNQYTDDINDVYDNTDPNSIIRAVAKVMMVGDEATEDENKSKICTDFISHFWNDYKNDHIRLKDNDGEYVYIKDANGKKITNKRRKYIHLKNTIASGSIGNVDIGENTGVTGRIYIPSEYEIANNEFLSDSHKELIDGLYNISTLIDRANEKCYLYINGKKYTEIDFPSTILYGPNKGQPFASNILDTTNNSLQMKITCGQVIPNYNVLFNTNDISGGLSGTVNLESRAFDNLKFSIGELAVFNKELSEYEMNLLFATMMYKWGFEQYLNPSNPYYEVSPNTINASFSDEINHPDKLAIDASRNYPRVKNFRTDSTRYSSKVAERRLLVLSSSFQDSSQNELNMSTFNSRKVPQEFELASDNDSKVFISKWDNEAGLLELSYRSNKKVDAFQVELGNFINNPEEYVLIENATGVGIVDTYSSETMVDRKWGTPVIGKGPGTYPHEKVNKIIYAVAPELYLDLEGPYPSRSLGSWPLPATTKGASVHLCTIKVDPDAFKGAPIIENFSLVSNDSLSQLDSDFVGSTTQDEIISTTGSLKQVEDLVRAGFYISGSSVDSINELADVYDSDGNDYVNVVDYMSVRNHIVLNGEVVKQSGNFVPHAFTSSVSNLPNYSFTVLTSSDASALSASLSWSLSGADTADSFQIWRRSINVNNQAAESGLWRLVASLSGSSWEDSEPPINRLAENQEDNPEFEYLLVASNEHGSSTYNSSTFQFPAYFSGDLIVNNISVTTHKGTEVVVMPSYYDNDSASPPYGTNEDNPSTFEFSFTPPDKAAGKFIKDATQTIFHFDPEYTNFVGRLTGIYTVKNLKTGDKVDGEYVINVLPKPFDLDYSQTKIVDAYSNIIYFDLNDVGSVDYVALQRTTNPSSWAGSRVGEWIKTKDLETNVVRIKDIIEASDYGDFISDQTLYYRVLAYEDVNSDSDLDQGTDLEILSNVLEVTCAAREKLETYTFPTPNAVSCASPSPNVNFQIPQLTSSAYNYAKSYIIEKYNGESYDFEKVYHTTDTLSPVEVTASVDSVEGCSGTYNEYFRVVGLSSDLMTTEYNVMTASLDKCPRVPIAKDATVNGCVNEEYSGDLKEYLSNFSGDLSAVVFSEVGSLLELTLNADGTFTYTPPSDTNVSFNYQATACGEISNTATISFDISDDCGLCPDDTDILCRYAKTNLEHPEYSGHTPYRYKNRDSSNIRLRELQEDKYTVTSNKT